MRAFWMCFSLLALLAASASGENPTAFVRQRGRGDYDAAYKKGRAEADQELNGNKATVYVYGFRLGSIERVDRETGLPLEAIAGCVVDDTILGRTAGHNDRITAYIKEKGVPRNSFKPWEKDLFGLKDYFASRSKSEQPLPLKIGGPAATSPDGRFSIRPVKESRKKDDGTFIDFLGVVAGDGKQPQPVAIVMGDDGSTDFLWGPKDSGFAVLRSRGLGSIRYLALDLKRGRWLRVEPDRKGE